MNVAEGTHSQYRNPSSNFFPAYSSMYFITLCIRKHIILKHRNPKISQFLADQSDPNEPADKPNKFQVQLTNQRSFTSQSFKHLQQHKLHKRMTNHNVSFTQQTATISKYLHKKSQKIYSSPFNCTLQLKPWHGLAVSAPYNYYLQLCCCTNCKLQQFAGYNPEVCGRFDTVAY